MRVPRLQQRYTYTLTNNANGIDTFNLSDSVVDGGISASQRTLKDSNGNIIVDNDGDGVARPDMTLGGSVTSQPSGNGVVNIPAGSELGLQVGDTVVTSGQFLLDSESQLQEAVQKLLAARLQAKRAGPQTSAAEHTHQEEDNQASSYWTCGMHPNIVQEGPGSCPICGMDLVEKKK